MKYVKVLISPEEEAALSECISEYQSTLVDPDPHTARSADLAYKWVCYVREVLTGEWNRLPEGSHLKDAYVDDVWTWNDSDFID